ncbi:DUF397 domain-containing protein [Streptomyces calidiresistens]|uniref:DUF397 domain-containing protein n=1 Tax=Streptomyces calidiresistens TaxID=1485586 RepID=A0A7W3SZU4_9ACTN|nr:DUF397 domain-containing protein [Streptomyces calidiresistens]MBB0228026.1 DUF397 domain-containing protein [Streptomyces calidiresistens]
MSTDRYTTHASEPTWFKSSYSGTSGGDCVEVTVGRNVVYVRDSKVAGVGPTLRVGRVEWSAFAAYTAK